MTRPEFTADEEFIIAYTKSPRAVGDSIAYLCGYIIGGAIVAGVAAYYDSVLMMLAAFIIVCGFRVYEEWFQYRWFPCWRSIIGKYEAAINLKGQTNPIDVDAGDSCD